MLTIIRSLWATLTYPRTPQELSNWSSRQTNLRDRDDV